jgi:hypothetical protein
LIVKKEIEDIITQRVYINIKCQEKNLEGEKGVMVDEEAG